MLRVLSTAGHRAENRRPKCNKVGSEKRAKACELQKKAVKTAITKGCSNMPHQNDTTSECHIANDAANDAANGDSSTATATTTAATAIATNTINDYNIKDDNADRSDANLSNDCDKPDYLNIECDRNLNIRCVGLNYVSLLLLCRHLSLSARMID